MIALACIYIASVLKDKDTTSWFEELHVDMNIVSVSLIFFQSLMIWLCPCINPSTFVCNTQVKNISMEILDFYDTYKIDPNRGLQEDKIVPVMNKLPSKAWSQV